MENIQDLKYFSLFKLLDQSYFYYDKVCNFQNTPNLNCQKMYIIVFERPE